MSSDRTAVDRDLLPSVVGLGQDKERLETMEVVTWDDEYDLEAFEDGKRAGYLLGRRAAEREALRTVTAIVGAAGGRVSVPDRFLEADAKEWRRWRDHANSAEVFEADYTAPPVSAAVLGPEETTP